MRNGVKLFLALGAVGASVPTLAAPDSASGLSFGASGAVTYDSNQLRSSGTGGSYDVRYSPSGSAAYNRALGLGSLDVNGLVGYDFFQRNTRLNRNRFGAGGSLASRAGSRCSAAVRGNFSERQNGVYDYGAVPVDPSTAAPATVDPSTVDGLPPDDVGRLIDNRQIFITYGLNAACGSPGGRLSFGGAASRATLDNGSPLRSFANSNSTSYSLFAGLGVFRPGQLQVNGSYSTIEYPNNLIVPGAPVSPVGTRTGVKTYRIGLTYARPIGTKLTGSVGVSYLTARPDGGQQPYTAPAYDVSLTYRPGNRLSLAALASRNVLSSTGAGALFRVVDVVQLSATYDLSRTISARANVGLIANNYRLPFVIPGELARRTDSSKLVGIGVNYAPRSRYDVGVNVTQTFRSSDSSIYNYNSTRASLTVSVHV